MLNFYMEIKIGNMYFDTDSKQIDTVTDIVDNLVYYNIARLDGLDLGAKSSFMKSSYEHLIKNKVLIKIDKKDYVNFLYDSYV